MELVVSKVLGLQKSNQWKDIWYHEFGIIAKVDGKDVECRLSVGSKSEVPPEVSAGTINVEAKPDYMGKKQFKLVKEKPAYPAGGSKAGFTPRSATVRNETSIVAQSSLKAAIEYCTLANHKATTDEVLKIADKFMDWVRAKG